jgi:N-acetyl-gamma-glutamyl-phosphate reductase
LSKCDVVFSCKKGGDTFPFIVEVLSGSAKFIDLSGDYRLKCPETFEQWYGIKHEHPGLLKEAVYGLPEWYRARIREGRLVANPGCYTTTTILACAPIIAAGFGVASPVLIDAISGVSGAGRVAKAENLYISVAENVRAYRVGNHQHTPEIEQELTAIAEVGRKRAKIKGAAQPIRTLFVPHVGPYKVGILASCYLRLDETFPVPTDDDLYEILRTVYLNEPFVRVYQPGALPQVESVVGTNYCDIAAKCDPRTGTIVIISATDNLVKGAAGQAVQNMNIMFGFEETAGLTGRL